MKIIQETGGVSVAAIAVGTVFAGDVNGVTSVFLRAYGVVVDLAKPMNTWRAEKSGIVVLQYKAYPHAVLILAPRTDDGLTLYTAPGAGGGGAAVGRIAPLHVDSDLLRKGTVSHDDSGD